MANQSMINEARIYNGEKTVTKSCWAATLKKNEIRTFSNTIHKNKMN